MFGLQLLGEGGRSRRGVMSGREGTEYFVWKIGVAPSGKEGKWGDPPYYPEEECRIIR